MAVLVANKVTKRFGGLQALININLEVKQSYLRTREAEQNIITIEKAVEQSKENLRITEEPCPDSN